MNGISVIDSFIPACKTNDFDSIAIGYDALSYLVFGDSLRCSESCFLPAIPPGAEILIIGGGTGNILKQLYELPIDLRIDYIEYSGKMLRMAKKHTPPARCLVSFIYGNETSIPENKKYDVVITHYFLDIFESERLKKVMRKLFDSLTTGGIWLICDFHLENTSPRLHKWMIKAMYCFFRVCCKIETQKLVSPDIFLASLPGIKLLTEAFFLNRLVKASLWVKS